VAVPPACDEFLWQEGCAVSECGVTSAVVRLTRDVPCAQCSLCCSGPCLLPGVLCVLNVRDASNDTCPTRC
jgi:hypothetical protein